MPELQEVPHQCSRLQHRLSQRQDGIPVKTVAVLHRNLASAPNHNHLLPQHRLQRQMQVPRKFPQLLLETLLLLKSRNCQESTVAIKHRSQCRARHHLQWHLVHQWHQLNQSQQALWLRHLDKPNQLQSRLLRQRTVCLTWTIRPWTSCLAKIWE